MHNQNFHTKLVQSKVILSDYGIFFLDNMLEDTKYYNLVINFVEDRIFVTIIAFVMKTKVIKTNFCKKNLLKYLHAGNCLYYTPSILV